MKVYIGSSLVRTPESPDDAPQFVAPNGIAIGSANPVLRDALTPCPETDRSAVLRRIACACHRA